MQTLLSDADWRIATIIVAFSILFPVLEIGVLAVLWARLRRSLELRHMGRGLFLPVAPVS